jgi:hypothetical protein
MPFQKGNKLAKGGKRKDAGRKSNQVKANEAEAIRIFRKRLAGSFGKLMDTAERLAKGIKRRRVDSEGRVYYETEYDTGMLKFLIERFIPTARQGTDLAVGTPEEFYQAIQQAKRDEKALVKKD